MGATVTGPEGAAVDDAISAVECPPGYWAARCDWVGAEGEISDGSAFDGDECNARVAVSRHRVRPLVTCISQSAFPEYNGFVNVARCAPCVLLPHQLGWSPTPGSG